jgi:hypothetical protein
MNKEEIIRAIDALNRVISSTFTNIDVREIAELKLVDLINML